MAFVSWSLVTLALENVTQVPPTSCARDLSPPPVGVGGSIYGSRETFIESRPSTARVKFGSGFVKRCSTTSTTVNSFVEKLVIFPAEFCLGSLLAKNAKLFGREHRPPGKKTMDREQEELQFLGLFGIFKESFKIILTWRKVFSQITLALILPLSFIFLAHIQISQLIFFKIVDNQDALYFTRSGTPKYDKLSDNISSEWTAFWLFKFAYFTFLLILSLLSTSAVVYTIACIYTAKPITFRKIMSVVPKVWKRLVVTFICSFVVVVVYNIIAAVVFLTLMTQVVYHVNTVGFRIAALVALIIVYSVGILYITIVWHLASVVSVLEKNYGIKAMIKSKNLIKGQMGVAVAIFIVVGVCFAGIQLLYEFFVVLEHKPLGVRIGVGIFCFLLLCKVMLFVLVIQTVLYFVCKSYHHESISKSSLSDHLEVYLGHYVALESKDVQMEQFQV